MTQEENEQITEGNKAATEIKKKSKQVHLDDMKKTSREKLSHGRHPLRTDNGDVDRTTTNHWFSSSSLKGETECSILKSSNTNISSKDP